MIPFTWRTSAPTLGVTSKMNTRAIGDLPLIVLTVSTRSFSITSISMLLLASFPASDRYKDLYCTIAKRHTSPVLAFNMQIRPNILPDLVQMYLHVDRKHSTYAPLCYLYNVDIKPASRGNDSHKTGVVKPAYGISTFALTAKAVWSKGHIIKKNVWVQTLKIGTMQLTESGADTRLGNKWGHTNAHKKEWPVVGHRFQRGSFFHALGRR